MIEFDVGGLLMQLALVGVNIIILGAGFLFKRSIVSMDHQIARIIEDGKDLSVAVHGDGVELGIKSRLVALEERVDSHDEYRAKSDKQVSKILHTVEMLTTEISKQNVKNAEQMGSLQSQVSECVGILKVLAGKNESL